MIDRALLSKPFLFSAGAIVIASVAVLWQLPPALQALFASGVSESPGDGGVGEQQAKHDRTTQEIRDRIIGRTMMFPPPSAVRPKPPVPTIIVKEKLPEALPPPPEYAGALTIGGIFGDEAWFSKGRNVVRLRVGQEDSGVKLVSTAPPWSAKVFWSGREYTVRLFKSWPTADVFESHPIKESGKTPGLIESPPDSGAGAPAAPGSMSSIAVSR